MKGEDQPEKLALEANERTDVARNTDLKLDRFGNPMIPQPSDDPNDPLNWSYMYRAYVAILVSTLAFCAQFGSALINSAYVPMAAELHVTIQQASYVTTTYIIAAGIFPMLMVPFANIWGRRPVYIFFTAVAAAANVGGGAARSYATLIVSRVFYGIGGGIPLALAPATIADMFPLGERGLWLGLYILMVNNGPHIAPIVGGYVALDLGWRWCFYIPGIIVGGICVIVFFTLRETLYSRTGGNMIENRSYIQNLVTRRKVLDRRLRGRDFIRPFYMARYLAVTAPAFYFATANQMGSILFAVTGSYLTKRLYNFNTAQTGLFLGVPLTIGCTLGEATAGWVSDFLTNARARRNGGVHVPETRLLLVPFGLIMTAGIIGYGWAIESHRPWIDLAVCAAISGCGLQYASTSVYTYVTDSYKPQTGEASAVLNLIKSLCAFTVGYFALPFGEGSGFGVAFTVLACVNVVFMIPMILLFFFGAQIREFQGQPNIHRDL